MLLLSVSSIYQERLWVQSERTARCMEAHTELSPSQTQAILAAFCCRTITTRGTAKSAPGPVAHPAAAWMPQPVRKYLTAVQRDLAPSARANGNCLRTTEMPSAGHNPSSTCSQISFPQYKLYVLTGILGYWRERTWDHSLSTTWRRKLVRPPPCRVFLSLSLPFPNYFVYFTWGFFSGWLS